MWLVYVYVDRCVYETLSKIMYNLPKIVCTFFKLLKNIIFFLAPLITNQNYTQCFPYSSCSGFSGCGAYFVNKIHTQLIN